jgi:hypothetical protein
MAVQRIKIWQWVLISLVAWAIAGMVLISSEDLSGPGDLNRQVFYRELHATTDDGRPLINDLVISPVIQSANGRSVQRVKFTRLMRNRETGEINALPGDFIAEIPFIKTDENADNRIGDYLAQLKTRVPELNYSYAWWQLSGLESSVPPEARESGMHAMIRGGVPFDRELHWWQYPRGMWIVLLVVSVITIGIIWPMIIKLLVKLGFGLPPEELAAFDLRHVSSKTTTDAPQKPGVTEADRDALDDLNAALEQNVSGMLVTDNSLDDAHERKQEAALVKKLSNQPAEAQAVSEKSDEPKDYTGEFYPVARPHGQK